MTADRISLQKTTARDMTSGNIWQQIVLYSLPLMLGNVFQMLYNTVDSIIVGQFVGTQALAAVGSTTMLVNMIVFFFNGFSTGAGVVIARCFGAKDSSELHRAVETTMAATFVLSLFFSIAGVAAVPVGLRLMSTPEDVFEQAVLYLRIYIGGISGLLIYNMGSGVLRAVGDTKRPLYFLILTSVLNILLDLLFVLVFHMGIAGAALATVLAQFLSSFLVLRLMLCTRDIYRLTWHDLRIDGKILGQIVSVGLPAAIQSVLTAFSNTFVQGYINSFGSSVMAGWSAYNKLDQFVFLPMQSLAMAATTFVSQNIGARKQKRADQGAVYTILMSVGITALLACLIMFFAGQSVGMFTQDAQVIAYGTLFIRTNTIFLLFNCVNHVLAGALRGRGDSAGPMVIMLANFVVVRQIYLFAVTRFIANTPRLVGFGYPVGWTACCITEVIYWFVTVRRKQSPAE